MHTKYYPIITALLPPSVANEAPFSESRRTPNRTEGQWRVLTKHTLGVTKYYPIYIKSFKFSTVHHIVESERFNLRFTDPASIESIADKLRWYRYRHSLLQRDVAKILGVDRTTYARYETAETDYYPIDYINKLAVMYDIPVTELLDAYNLFLYNNQGEQIRSTRQSLGLTQSAYAKTLGVPLGTLKKWEQNRARIFKSTWEKYFS